MIKTLYIGSYTIVGGRDRPPHKGGDGIYVYKLDTETGKTRLQDICTNVVNPSFLAVNGNHLYACEEIRGGSAVASFVMNEDGSLMKTAETVTTESGMCYVLIWPDGKTLTACNFGSGNFVNMHIEDDGRIGPVLQLTQHEGSGPGRMQQTAHVHSAAKYPDGKSFLVCDLGNDTLCTYAMDQDTGKTTLIQTVNAEPGDGPRHSAFSPDGRFVTICTQLSNVLITYEVADGKLGKCVSRVQMIPGEYTERNDGADVHYSSDNRYLYASNRGHNSIVAFKVNEDGTLTDPHWFSSGGNSPRQFLIAAQDMMVITNQRSGNFLTVRVDPETGMIGETLDEQTVPEAVFAGIFE